MPAAPARIDINRAAWYEWMLLEGIGEARARGIVAYREENGPFGSIDDLKAVPRMPAGWVERAREHLTVAPHDPAPVAPHDPAPGAPHDPAPGGPAGGAEGAR